MTLRGVIPNARAFTGGRRISRALQAFDLPAKYPNDPVDRIIGATALVEDIPLVTADREIRKSRVVPTIW